MQDHYRRDDVGALIPKGQGIGEIAQAAPLQFQQQQLVHPLALPEHLYCTETA